MLEQMYNDFVTKVLPKAQEGLIITKEYFTDLFGRYVHYLIIIDILSIVFEIILTATFILLTIKFINNGKKANYSEYDMPVYYLGGILTFILSIILVGCIFKDIKNLIMTIYIPEVRIYQEIQYLK